jgi:hypothetical protein
MNDKIERICDRTRALRPTIEAHRGEGDGLYHLPDAIARAFVEANVYRLLLPHELGGEDIDPVNYYDSVEEVYSYDGSVGWNYSMNRRRSSGRSGTLTQPERTSPPAAL